MKFLDKWFGRSGNRMFQSFYLYAQAREGNLTDWYVQDCKHFDKYRPELMKLAFDGNKGWEEAISIHIRRGKNPSVPEEPNYSENPFYIDLTQTDYYQRAMELFPNVIFMVFSDDIEWSRGYFKNHERKQNILFFHETEEEDFKTMASCMGHIIANSSFSYMAAYLGGGKTIAPKQWFADGVQRVGFPSDWILI